MSAGVLKAHIRTHTGLKAFKCLICNGAFTTGGSLRRHMGIHNDLRPYMCPYCQKTFKTSLNCKKHMKTHRYVYNFYTNPSMYFGSPFLKVLQKAALLSNKC